ncbi:MAG TPA: hypothetical protein VGL55_15470 [Steroidobacteraceae bacterium]|jgi:hypothetical protein
MSEPQQIVAFRGPVYCRQEDGPLALTLEGRSAEPFERQLSVAFSFAVCAPPALPDTLQEVSVERLQTMGAGSDGDSDLGSRAGQDTICFRLRSGQQAWEFRAAACHLHREVSSQFYRAIPPRQAPWSKRMFWRMILALAAWPIGKRLLLAMRR